MLGFLSLVTDCKLLYNADCYSNWIQLQEIMNINILEWHMGKGFIAQLEIICGLSCNAFSTPLQNTKPTLLFVDWLAWHPHIQNTAPSSLPCNVFQESALKLLLVMYLLVTIIHDYLRGNPSLLFGRPYQVVFPTHGVAAHSMEDPVWAGLMVQEIPLKKPLLLRENDGCRSWPLLSCYTREGTAVRYYGPSSQGIIPWQQCLPLYRSSYLWTIVVTAGQSREERKDRILLHRERTPKETIISLKCDLNHDNWA
jgi:hypothetical protein